MTDERLLAADDAARVAALDVRKSFLVQAPAGSGKTELLIQRYLRLLAIVDNPEEILAITFTRKAAAEMRLRVLHALQAAQDGESPRESHQQITFEAAELVLARDRELKWQLLSNANRMRIQTLDALNMAVSRMLPVSSGSGAGQFAIATEAEMSALYSNAATLTLDQLVETGPIHDATELVLRHVDNNTFLYTNYVARMLATRDQWLPLVGSGALGTDDARYLRQRFENNLRDAVGDYLARLRAAIPDFVYTRLLEAARYAAGQLIDAGDTGAPIARLADIDMNTLADDDAAWAWQCIAELMLTKGGTWRRRITVAEGFPPKDGGQKKAFAGLIDELQDEHLFCEMLHGCRELPPVSYSETQWEVLLALFRLLPLAVTELQRLCGERGVTDYIEVALCAADALGTAENPGDIALLLDYQLRHLLVDEMQDTSNAQYRMLESLTGGWQPGDGRTLFCVGDPMQSIYRFRNAEVGQFLLARHAGIGGVPMEVLTLRRNFRSGEKLVDWFNSVFPRVLSEVDDASRSAVAYAEAVSVPRLAGQGECHVHAMFGNNDRQAAERGVSVIATVMENHPGDDMAVLVRSRTHLHKLLAGLREREIPYRAIEIDRLTDLPEIIDVLALTRALVHRGDRLAWLSLLRSPWAGLDWTDLHALVDGVSSDTTIWELLGDDGRLTALSEAGRRGARRVRGLLREDVGANPYERLRDRVERGWFSLGGPAILESGQAVENVYRYFDVIERLETGGTLTDVAELEQALDHERVSSDSTARLHIMTMHRAKGLQFDHVLLFGLGKIPRSHDRPVLSWLDLPGEHGGNEKIVSPVGPRAEIEGDPLYKFIASAETRKFRNELGRLLYVACTRAKKSLHLLGHVGVSSEGSDFRPPTSGSLLELLWPAVADDFQRAFDSHRPTPQYDRSDPWQLPALRRFDGEWALPEFSDPRGAEIAALPVDEPAEVEFYWVGSAARIAGTLVHRWLQLAAANPTLLEANGKSIAAVTEKWVRDIGIRDAMAHEVTSRVDEALRKTMDDDKGRWVLGGEGDAELGLSGLYDGQVSSVVLDRVRIDEQGTHWIVDYKTSTHEGGNLQAFLQAEIARYTPQLKKYRHLYGNYADAEVRCALYFPLLQTFVEVPL